MLLEKYILEMDKQSSGWFLKPFNGLAIGSVYIFSLSCSERMSSDSSELQPDTGKESPHWQSESNCRHPFSQGWW